MQIPNPKSQIPNLKKFQIPNPKFQIDKIPNPKFNNHGFSGDFLEINLPALFEAINISVRSTIEFPLTSVFT